MVTSGLRNSHTTSHPRIHISPRKKSNNCQPKDALFLIKSHTTRGGIWLRSQLPSTRVYGDYQLKIAINSSILASNRTRSAAECHPYAQRATQEFIFPPKVPQYMYRREQQSFFVLPNLTKKNLLLCHTNQVLQISLGQRQLLRSDKRKELKKNIGTARVSALFVSHLSQH